MFSLAAQQSCSEAVDEFTSGLSWPDVGVEVPQSKLWSPVFEVAFLTDRFCTTKQSQLQTQAVHHSGLSVVRCLKTDKICFCHQQVRLLWGIEFFLHSSSSQQFISCHGLESFDAWKPTRYVFCHQQVRLLWGIEFFLHNSRYSFQHNMDSRLADYSIGFAYVGPGCVEMKCEKTFQEKKLSDNLGQIWTPDFCCSFITDKALSYSVSPDWNLSLDLFCSFIKDTSLSYCFDGLLEHSTQQSLRASVKIPYILAVEHHTKTKSITTQILKPCNFRPTKKKQISSDP